MLNYLNRKDFGDINAFMNSHYIDYLLKDIRRFNTLNTNEEMIIKSAKRKLRFLNFLNFCFFLFSLKRIYRVSLTPGVENNVITRNITGSLAIIALIYYSGQRIYYNDLKYLILKYTSLSRDRYIKSQASRDKLS
jgi:hypothetical protein